MYNRLLRYREKCVVLKRIQSNKSRFFRRLNYFQNFLTVFVSAFITFIGFSGMEKIREYVKLIFNKDISLQVVEMSFNLLVFILFFIGVSYLVFHFSEKQNESDRAIILLSNLINEIDNLLSFSGKDSANIKMISEKYEIIIQSIPSNSDREYKKAKKSIKPGNTSGNPLVLFERVKPLTAEEQEAILLEIIQNDSLIQNILDTIAKHDEKLYLGGGVIRNRVWDLLHNYSSNTQMEDFDIIYFDKADASKQHDLRIEEKLKKQMPNMIWSVKNQARMHTVNHDDEYTSLEDALSKWPETASAILIRKDSEDTYDIIAPFQFDDLFKLIVRPTPHFLNNKLDMYKKRINEKKWNERWNLLKIFYSY